MYLPQFPLKRRNRIQYVYKSFIVDCVRSSTSTKLENIEIVELSQECPSLVWLMFFLKTKTFFRGFCYEAGTTDLKTNKNVGGHQGDQMHFRKNRPK
jgi:hypothetical protein